MNAFHDLDDRQWAAVCGLLPRCGPGGPDYRSIVNGILWQQDGGRRWHDLPPRYGPWHRCAERLRLWSIDGTWQNILTTLAESGYVGESTATDEAAESGATVTEAARNQNTAEYWNRPWLG
ncbi:MULTISPECIES: transposase [unclassified Streptomyces]|uniref:transposase n=1 Tax=unclassified Streptomyces TaxID=2593676 RepID=UPI002E381629|nr:MULTISPECIES: transposase [unclassified Streptomyces]WUC63034.1 transposase [Streptomyces sp. NBC_00539]